MANFKTVVMEQEVLRIPYKTLKTIFWIGKALIVLWLPYILENPRRIRFIPGWLFSFRPKASSFENGYPLLSPEFLEWLESFLNKDMKAFEYGSGMSTLFIAKRVKELISIEHSPKWHHLVSEKLKESNISNCRSILIEPEYSTGNDYRSMDRQYENLSFEKYCKAIENYPDNYFNFVFVDGRARDFCLPHASKKVRPGGVLILDDSERKRYFKAMEVLKDWKRKDFWGPRNYVKGFYKTTIYQKKTS